MKKIILPILLSIMVLTSSCSIKPTTKTTNDKQLDYPINYAKSVGLADFKFDAKEGQATYGKLDELGRPTYATIIITPELFEKEKSEKREDIKINPCGWPKENPKVEVHHRDGTTYRGYFWNRSHMIADSLGGDPVVENLVTGTRAQNVGTRSNDGGMAFLETKIRDYFNNGGKESVRYEVVNNYKDDELLPRTTTVNAKTEDGIDINNQVVVYNVMNGFDINYRDASFNQIK